jgi:tetratricopeptide (TPR) repeat protein
MADEPKKKKKKQNVAEMQKQLRDLAKPSPEQADKPPIDLKKIYVRVGAVLAVLWVVALIASRWASYVPFAIAGVITLVAAGAGVWISRYLKKTQALGALLRSAESEEDRKKALEKLSTEFKKGDVQATLARAQLEMQDDPRKALATLESINLEKQLAPVADQVRAMRAMIHLTLGETAEARALVDKLDLGKTQEPKTRAMFATVAGEAWGRTGQAKKAVELLEVFNPEDPDFAEMRVQMWRARAFAYAGAGDMKGASRALKKLAELNPQLLGMFISTKRIHPLLQQEAKQILMRSGAVPRKMVRQKL